MCVSPTHQDFYNWLKLEDIRSSLFVAACRNKCGRSPLAVRPHPLRTHVRLTPLPRLRFSAPFCNLAPLPSARPPPGRPRVAAWESACPAI
jgi:hypothetical protein